MPGSIDATFTPLALPAAAPGIGASSQPAAAGPAAHGAAIIPLPNRGHAAAAGSATAAAGQQWPVKARLRRRSATSDAASTAAPAASGRLALLQSPTSGAIALAKRVGPGRQCKAALAPTLLGLVLLAMSAAPLGEPALAPSTQRVTAAVAPAAVEPMARVRLPMLPPPADILLIGGRQWQLARPDLLAPRRAAVVHLDRLHAAELEHRLAPLLAADRLPQMLIVGIDDASFGPPPMAGVGAERMAAEPAGRSIVDLHGWHGHGPAADAPLPDRAARSLSIEPAGGPAAPQSAVMAGSPRPRAVLDESELAALDALLGDLNQRNVAVVLAIAPLDLAAYERRSLDELSRLDEIEAVAVALAEAHGLRLLGGFDPAQAGCLEGGPGRLDLSPPACMARLLEPLLKVGAAPLDRSPDQG